MSGSKQNMHLNKKASYKTRLLISLHHADVSGEKNPMFGKKRPQHVRDAISKANKERVWTDEMRLKHGLAHKGIKQTEEWIEKRISQVRGEKNYNWKGGITPENEKIRASLQYKRWRTAIFERDNYRCQECWIRGGYLEVHHIYEFSQFPQLRFVINNGITLHKSCHPRQGRPRYATI